MDPIKDLGRANEIINYHKDRLGLKGVYRLKIENELAGCAKPDFLSLFLPNYLQNFRKGIHIQFDRKYFEKLGEEEFTALILHELAHIKDKHGLKEMGFICSPCVVLYFFLSPVSLFFLFILVLLPTFFFIHRRFEYNADKFVKEYDNSRYKYAMISALEKAELCPSTTNFIERFFLRLSHPSGKDRIERLKDP